jgi:hypothetical protein
MVDFTNPNLLGASLDLNNLLSNLSSSSALIESLLDASAAAAAAALGANQNVLSGLMSKLQTIEIPTLPKLNLQAEIASIASLVPGSSSFIQSFAKIESEFGGDLTAKGLELASLVNNASDAILGGNSISSIVPNLVKEAGNDILAAVEIPDAVSRTIGVAVPEVLSTVNQNKAILARIKNTASLASATDVVASVAEEILISAAGGETVKVVPPGTGANVTPAGTVFTHKKGSNYDADIWSA